MTNPKFTTTNDIPINKFKGYYAKIARTIFAELANSEKKGGFLIEKNPQHLKGIYNSMKSLIAHGEYKFEVSLVTEENKIWIMKEEGMKP